MAPYVNLHYILIFFLISIVYVFSLEFRYHSQDELERLMYEFSENVREPLEARVYSIGKSKGGRDLLVFELTAAKNNSETVPNIQLTGNIHGNETPGREILLHLIEYLISNYDENDRIRWLLDNTRIHILPCLNPDGWEVAEIGDCAGLEGRNNLDDYDLNRNFPNFVPGEEEVEQVETKAIKEWNRNVSFVLAGDLHAGAVVTIYPFHKMTKTKYGYESQSSITPDDKIFEHIANVYARNNVVMYQQTIFCDNETFPGGITRGASWYYFLGGMQDYNYIEHGTMALTFEISCCKYPPEENLTEIWEQNKKSLIMFCCEANRGVTANVRESNTGKPITNANVTILGIDKVIHTNEDGRLWKILLPGKYYLRVDADGYETVENTFIVEYEDEEFPKLTKLEIVMNRS
ncbi:carboxypeptidase D-like [Coccinella septempunctata]|uniref:carboxypeptidase D-like n=1 Tax=Coccinella septempunctata TaxID=41139 RepID=UPI001D0685C6|nr:carboxypeptidase D-like [Coccinella septempunctata]